MKQVLFICLSICLLVTPSSSHAADKAASRSPSAILPAGFSYPPEHIYDARVYPEDALVNVQIESNRWPNCQTFESTIQSIFRIEGVTDKSDEEKALALWRWFRILTSATGGGYAYEGAIVGKEKLVHDGHKILTVYGHHQCDGLSWAMVPLWRAAGYIAFDEASHGHTTASLRYRDHDDLQRFHSFDPQGRFFWWNPKLRVVGNRTLPLMQGTVHRHLTLPQRVHSLRTSLHVNETVERRWRNVGHVVPSGKQPAEIALGRYYRYRHGKTDGIYAVIGTEIQTFTPELTLDGYQADLSERSRNIAATRLDGGGLLHPAAVGTPAEAVYRIASPYVAVDATLDLDLRRTNADDAFRLYLSRDGERWALIREPSGTGEQQVRLKLGRIARAAGKPNIYTAYAFFLKVEMIARRSPTDVGLKNLHLTVHRMLNKRTLPNLMPGENILKVSADAIAPGKALALTMDYSVKGKPYTERHRITDFPYFFRVQVPGAKAEIRKNYDRDFGSGDIRMGAIALRLVEAKPSAALPPSVVDAEYARKAFSKANPHPAGDMLLNRRKMKQTESDITQTNGFFPQPNPFALAGGDRANHVAGLVERLQTGKDWAPDTWRAAEELGNYPEAIDALLAELPEANIDLTVFVCKALAQLKDPKAIDPLLDKWRMVPEGAPGNRYIPDALAAIGDPRVVPDLASKLKHVRFDYRFHIAHALGKLGGDAAHRALFDLSQNDPFPAVRREAEGWLRELEGGRTEEQKVRR